MRGIKIVLLFTIPTLLLGEPVSMLLQEGGVLSGYATFQHNECNFGTADLPIIVIAQTPDSTIPSSEGAVSLEYNLSRTSLIGIDLDETPSFSNPAGADLAKTTWAEPPLPPNILIPDETGNLLINRPRNGSEAQQQNPRNPWGIRVTTKASVTEYALRLEAIIIGPEPTVLLNGFPLQRGEKQIGQFTLAFIRRHEVVMEFDGVYFLIPEGKTIIVQVPKN